MNRSNHIQDELNGLNSSLPSEVNSGPYAVPDGYFDEFAATVLARIKGSQSLTAAEEISQLSPLLAGISRSMPFELPAGYFQSNIDVLPAITFDEEESLVLSFIDKEMPYEVPRGYFANFPEQVLETAEANRPRVVKMSGRKWIRMAVAAMIAGIVAFSGITYFSGNRNSTGSSNNTVAVNQTTGTQRQDLKKDLKTVSTEELDAFIKTTAVTVNTTATAQNTPKASDVKTFLKDVSDKELDQFLDEVPTEDGADDIVL
jgi:hypothetical protein